MRRSTYKKLHRRFIGFMHGYNKHVNLENLDIIDIIDLMIDYAM